MGRIRQRITSLKPVWACGKTQFESTNNKEIQNIKTDRFRDF